MSSASIFKNFIHVQARSNITFLATFNKSLVGIEELPCRVGKKEGERVKSAVKNHLVLANETCPIAVPEHGFGNYSKSWSWRDFSSAGFTLFPRSVAGTLPSNGALVLSWAFFLFALVLIQGGADPPPEKRYAAMPPPPPALSQLLSWFVLLARAPDDCLSKVCWWTNVERMEKGRLHPGQRSRASPDSSSGGEEPEHSSLLLDDEQEEEEMLLEEPIPFDEIPGRDGRPLTFGDQSLFGFPAPRCPTGSMPLSPFMTMAQSDKSLIPRRFRSAESSRAKYRARRFKARRSDDETLYSLSQEPGKFLLAGRKRGLAPFIDTAEPTWPTCSGSPKTFDRKMTPIKLTVVIKTESGKEFRNYPNDAFVYGQIAKSELEPEDRQKRHADCRWPLGDRGQGPASSADTLRLASLLGVAPTKKVTFPVGQAL